MAGPKHTELPAVVVPQHLWLRSGRPTQGKVVQWTLSLALIVAGLSMFERQGLRVGFVIAGLALFLTLPAIVVARLEQLGRAVHDADRERAEELLTSLPRRPIVRLFAPAGWTSLQLALLNLKLGNGHAAADGFAETARLCHQPDAVMLLSAQAHALVLAGERKQARELLQKLAGANMLGPRDQLDFGVCLLIDTKKQKQATNYIEAARKTVGDHPRVLAALALGLQKGERIDEASELLERVQIAIKDEPPDPVTEDLIKRARKGLQDYLEAQLRRERRARSRRTTIVVSSEAAASEIVSGEIGTATEPTASETGSKPDVASVVTSMGETEAPRRFVQVEVPVPPVEPAPAPRPQVREPDAPQGPATRDPDAPQQATLEIDLFSVPHTSAPAAVAAVKQQVEARPAPGSLAAALAGEPVQVEVPKRPPNQAEAAAPSPPKVEAPGVPRVATPVPSAAPGVPRVLTPAPGVPRVATPVPGVHTVAPPVTSAEPPKPDSDVPTMRRRQTMIGVLPTGPGEPAKPPAPTLPSLSQMSPPTPAPGLPAAMPRTGLPTRATRHDLPAIGFSPTTPAKPMAAFKAPVARTSDSDKDEPGKGGEST